MKFRLRLLGLGHISDVDEPRWIIMWELVAWKQTEFMTFSTILEVIRSIRSEHPAQVMHASFAILHFAAVSDFCLCVMWNAVLVAKSVSCLLIALAMSRAYHVVDHSVYCLHTELSPWVSMSWLCGLYTGHSHRTRSTGIRVPTK